MKTLLEQQKFENKSVTLIKKSSAKIRDFQHGTSGKESACQSRRCNRGGQIPGSGRSPRERHGNSLQYSCLENTMDRGAWRATVHRVRVWQDCSNFAFTQLKLETIQAWKESSHTQPYIDNDFKQEKTYAHTHATHISYKKTLPTLLPSRKQTVWPKTAQPIRGCGRMKPMKRLYTLNFQLPPIDSLVTAVLANTLFFPIN